MPTTRRDMFRQAATTWAVMSQALRAAPVNPGAGNEDYWKLVKRQFPLDDHLLYLNAANVCPASRGVLDRHTE